MRFVEALGQLLLAAESSGAGWSGSLIVSQQGGEEELGRIVVQRGRIAWARSRRTAAEFPRSLADAAGLTLDDLLQRLHEAHDRPGTLCERLIEAADLPVERLRRVFLHHTADAVADMAMGISCEGAEPPLREGQDLAEGSKLLSFSPAEVLAEVLGGFPEVARLLGPPPPLFLKVASRIEAAVCFIELEDPAVPALPIAVVGALRLKLTESLQLFERARRMARMLPGSRSGDAPFVVMIKGEVHGWMASFAGRYVCLFRTRRPSDYGRILALVHAGAARVA